jgi:hypothetical protein
MGAVSGREKVCTGSLTHSTPGNTRLTVLENYENFDHWAQLGR